VIGLVKKPRKPTKVLRALLAGKPIDDEILELDQLAKP
jgi:hypothetical protein